MPTYIAEGRIIPERTVLNLAPLEGRLLTWDGAQVSFKVSLILSRVFVVFSADAAIQIPELRALLFTLLGNITNTICFKQVFGLSYEIDSITNADTGDSELLGADGHVFDVADEASGNFTFKTIRDGDSYSFPYTMLSDLHFTRAVFELRCAIRYPDFTALHCRLAVESIRNYFEGPGEDVQWAAMRAALKVDRSAITSFKSAADDQRHGRNRDQTWIQRKAAMQIAWEIVNRYTLYRDDAAGLANVSVLTC